MISQKNLKDLAPVIEKAVGDVFKVARNNEANSNDFVLFLNNAYKLEKTNKGYSPYCLGPGIDRIFDKDRNEFVKDFLELEYYYEQEYNKTENEKTKEKMKKITTHLELMIYTHAWESIPNLKDLKHIANLVNSEEYNWEIEIPKYGKYNFITNEIIGVFIEHDLEIADIISKSYHSQLRNAFAHSQYTFFQKGIRLGNFEGEDWQKESISYKEWEERFIKTILLFNYIIKKKYEYIYRDAA